MTARPRKPQQCENIMGWMCRIIQFIAGDWEKLNVFSWASLPCSCFKVPLLHNSTTRGRLCPKNWWSSSVLMFFVVYYSAADFRTAEGCQSFSLPFVPAAGCSVGFTQAQHVQSSYGQTLDWTQSSFAFTTADCSIRVEQKTCWHPTGKNGHKPVGKTIHGAPLCFRCSGYHITTSPHYYHTL